MSDQASDILIIGAGIAGASAAAELSTTHRVTLLERENMPGYHSTGRSAALFSEIYGGAPVRALSRASRDFFFSPPEGFAAHPLIKRRGALYVASARQLASLAAFTANPDVEPAVHTISCADALAACPILRPKYVSAAVLEPDASDVDVHALHEGYLRLFRRNGGTLVTDAEVQTLEWRGGAWHARTTAGGFQAPVAVNAAGAWADTIAAKAGVAIQHIQPRRRTALLVELPPGINPDAWPMTIDIDETFYFKPDGGLLLVSPADETAVDACDVQAEEIDVAMAIDRVEKATTLQIKRIRKKWAGLRSFGPDRAPAVGFDPAASGFFWLAGQGGYGIQTAPAVAKLAAALIRGEALPPALHGFDPASVSPARAHPPSPNV
ncbi:MAG TPA: FAD-dependent oxidoreductase [Rhizomicrobium sp.]|jgi:D-arginine dehydrogenase